MDRETIAYPEIDGFPREAGGYWAERWMDPAGGWRLLRVYADRGGPGGIVGYFDGNPRAIDADLWRLEFRSQWRLYGPVPWPADKLERVADGLRETGG